jgi:hypothetical protein
MFPDDVSESSMDVSHILWEYVLIPWGILLMSSGDSSHVLEKFSNIPRKLISCPWETFLESSRDLS